MVYARLFFAIGVIALFVACGGDSSSGAKDTDKAAEPAEASDIVADTFDDLPVCTDKREGATAYVKDEKNAYVCADGDWTVDDNEDVISGPDPESSSSEGLSSSSSKTVDKDPTSSSEEFALTDMAISGVTQKGPFLKGSKVTVYELESGHTLSQTGNTFATTIQSDDGKFKLNARTMVSQYIELHAEGYYRNEVTGDNSKSQLALYALTDASKREGGVVNINLLTHLEYFRVIYLVKQKKMKVFEAKKKVQQEILNAFYVNDEIASFEDLDIFSSGDGNAALLAISVLMQSNLDEAKLSELLTNFASVIEENGKWDDETTKAKIADWARSKDLADSLAVIRGNITKWKLGDVPDFEKYFRNFWYVNYGLGTCGSNNNGEVSATKNELSNTYGTETRFICKSGAWVESNDIEKDTYQWAVGEDGEIKTGDVTKTKKYIYDGKLKKWRAATPIEVALGCCTETRAADIEHNTGKMDGIWYICKNREWQSTNSITVDTQGWGNGSDGELKKGNITDDIYKYDEALGKWVMATSNDTTLKLMACTTNRFGEIGQSPTDHAYYICKNFDWLIAQEIEYDTYGEKCTSAEVGKVITGVKISTNKYYCTANGWISLGSGWSWDVPKEARLNPEITYGNLTDSRDGKTYKMIKIGDLTWMAENLNYYDANDWNVKTKSWCYGQSDNGNSATCDVAGRLYTWAAAIDSVKLYADKGEVCGYEKYCTLPDTVYGICPPGWHLPSKAEWENLITAAGGSSTAGSALKSLTGWYRRGNGTDALGFSGLPAGIRHDSGFGYEGSFAHFWTATECDDWSAYFLTMFDDSEEAYQTNNSKANAFSVRCVKNQQ